MLLTFFTSEVDKLQKQIWTVEPIYARLDHETHTWESHTMDKSKLSWKIQSKCIVELNFGWNELKNINRHSTPRVALYGDGCIPNPKKLIADVQPTTTACYTQIILTATSGTTRFQLSVLKLTLTLNFWSWETKLKILSSYSNLLLVKKKRTAQRRKISTRPLKRRQNRQYFWDEADLSQTPKLGIWD